MEKENQNIYILNIHMSHFRDKKRTCNHKILIHINLCCKVYVVIK